MPSLMCFAGSVGFLGVLALLAHVGAEGHGECRSCYSVPSMFAVLGGAGIAIERVIASTSFKYAPVSLSLVTCIYLCVTKGMPDKSQVLVEYEKRWGRWRDLLVQYECTHIGGNSWFAYDVMFYTNYCYYREGSKFRLYPYTFRDTPYREHALSAVNDVSLLGICNSYDMSRDYYNLNRRDNGVKVGKSDLCDEEGFQLHTIRKIER